MIHLAFPYRPDFIWTAGYLPLIEAIKRQTAAHFDPEWERSPYPVDLDGPLLTVVQSVNMLPIWPQYRSTVRNVAIAVPVEQFLVPKYILNAKRNWDHLIAGSNWAADMIREAGFSEVSVITHGAHPHYTPGVPGPAPERFTIFSGGKLELRKSQDVVIHAVGHLMNKYRDVHLVTDWYNPWPAVEKSFWAAPLMQRHAGLNLHTAMRRCGIDLARTRSLDTEFSSVAEHTADKLLAFRSADVGLFPNRAEACPNSFLVEMMGCEKPVIALYEHGHRDVLDPDDPLTCHTSTPILVSANQGKLESSWYEPDLEEVIAKLEWAYWHREHLPELGKANCDRLRPFALDQVASRYIAACQG